MKCRIRSVRLVLRQRLRERLQPDEIDFLHTPDDFLAYAGTGRTATRLFTSESRSMAGLELRMPSVSASADCTSLMWRGAPSCHSKARSYYLRYPGSYILHGDLRKLDLLNNANVRRAGRAGYRGLQAFALIFVFALMLMVVVAPFAVIYGNQAPPALAPALLAAAIFLTWRLYRWFFGRDKKNST